MEALYQHASVSFMDKAASTTTLEIGPSLWIKACAANLFITFN